jgi:hypothetical protein
MNCPKCGEEDRMKTATIYDDFDHLIDRCKDKYKETEVVRWRYVENFERYATRGE